MESVPGEVPYTPDATRAALKELERAALQLPGVSFAGLHIGEGNVLTAVIGGPRLGVLQAFVPAWVAQLPPGTKLMLVRGTTATACPG